MKNQLIATSHAALNVLATFFEKNKKFNIFHVDKIKIVKLLIAKGANVNANDRHGVTGLMRSGEQGENVEMLTFLQYKKITENQFYF